MGKWLEGCDLSGGQRGDTLPLGKLDGSRRRVCQQNGKERREDEPFVQHLDVGSRRNTVLARNGRSTVLTIYRNFKIIHLPECSSERPWQATNHVMMCMLFGGCHMRRSFGGSEQEAASEYCCPCLSGEFNEGTEGYSSN